MNCNNCHFQAPPDAQFCPKCGARLVIICIECETENSPSRSDGGKGAARVDMKTTKVIERQLKGRQHLEGEDMKIYFFNSKLFQHIFKSNYHFYDYAWPFSLL